MSDTSSAPEVEVLTDVPQSLAVDLQTAEINQAISTARALPRNITQVQARVTALATLDEETAEECMYALPRKGKPIQGPSIRFAEILKQAFGNCRVAARVVHVDRNEKFVEAEGVFHDLETNSATSARVRRRIVDKKGNLYSDDMIIVTGNAACAIAMRNAILAGVPKPLWRQAYDKVRSIVAGDIDLLSVKREQSTKAFANYGVTPEQVLASLGKETMDDIGQDEIVLMRGMLSALKNGEATVEEMFGRAQARSDHERVEDPLSDDAASKEQKSA
eukprot:g17207.t1